MLKFKYATKVLIRYKTSGRGSYHARMIAHFVSLSKHDNSEMAKKAALSEAVRFSRSKGYDISSISVGKPKKLPKLIPFNKHIKDYV